MKQEITKSEVREVLIAAKQLIADPKDWCGDGGAEGVGVGPRGEYCTTQALVMVTAGRLLWEHESETHFGQTYANSALDALRPFVPPEYHDDVAAWNDLPTTTHQMVMEAFDRAIESQTETPSLTENTNNQEPENRNCEIRRRSPEVVELGVKV